MTRRRRLIVLATVNVLLTGAAVALVLYARQSPFERAYHRIKLGMTKDEVTAAVGLESYDYLSFGELQQVVMATVITQAGEAPDVADDFSLPVGMKVHHWYTGGSDWIIVVFDRDGRATYKQLSRYRPEELTGS